DLAGLGNEPAREVLVYERQVLMRDIEQRDIFGPAIGLLRAFVDALSNKLLAIGQDLDLMHGAVRRFERRAHFLERGDAAERNQPLGREPGALQHRPGRAYVEQRLFDLISDARIPNVDIEGRRLTRTNAGA